MLVYELEAKEPFGIAYSDSPSQNEFSLLSMLYFVDDVDTPTQCRIEFYIMKSETDATEFLSNNSGNENYNMFADKNIIVCESKENPGLYEEIKTKRFANNQQPEQFRQAIASLNKVKTYSILSVQFLTSIYYTKDRELLKKRCAKRQI